PAPRTPDALTEETELLEAPPAAASTAPAPAKKPREEPSTIAIQETGKYRIDVEALLHDSPIIVEKEGVYLIHLPSAFENAQKQGKA
ncbi:MAG TPA: Zn-ribbon containing protein, partial [Candidatus Thermoplasmatota archaeon]|nr:Zn-ribbon containing protein [Candidatus Thermoplasmatota archaeon]